MNGRMAALAAAIAAAACAAAEPVEVRVEKKTYPVIQPDAERAARRPWAYAAKLKGKQSYTTEAVILANKYLRITILPELGGRIVRGVYRPSNRQMFWEYDEIRDGVSWSMGGCRWSFPFWEHGRHFDETGGYTITRHDDGSATVAVDMRFDDFLAPAETGRYGRATNLRLVQFVHLQPDAAAYTWTARVENPLPIRHGLKLWYLMRQPAIEGIKVILPAAATTGHGSGDLKAWDRDATIGTAGGSRFAVGIRHDFAGWYFPQRDFNVLRVHDRRIAPGAKQVLYGPNPKGYIEMWGGNNEVFEECGRMLPAFGSCELSMKVIAAEGIGRASFANEHAVIHAEKTDKGWRLALAATRPIEGAELGWTCGGAKGSAASAGATGGQKDLSLAPDRPFARDLGAGFNGPRLRVRLTGRDGAVLADQLFPVDVGPMPEKEFAGTQARTRGTMPGGKGLYAEATDLTSEHQFSLPRAAGFHAEILKTSDEPRELLDAARRLLRVRKDSPDVLAGLDKVLAKRPKDPWANLYKGIWLLEAARDDEAAKYLARAADLPGARLLLALRDVAGGRLDAAVRRLRTLLDAKPADTFYGKDDPAFLLLQPAAAVSPAMPMLLLADLHIRQGGAAEARRILQRLVERDPACIEAWMLLGDKDKLRTLTAANPAGKRAAEKTLTMLRTGRWPGIGRP